MGKFERFHRTLHAEFLMG
jgi:hypothetical protein